MIIINAALCFQQFVKHEIPITSNNSQLIA